MIRHERLIGAFLYWLAGACFFAVLVSFVRLEYGWSIVFACAFTACVGCVWNIEDRRLAE